MPEPAPVRSPGIDGLPGSGLPVWRRLLDRHGVALASALAAALVAVLARPPVLADDAAISLRYAARLAAGQGLTYNGHEAVLGASNPLWTVLVAGGSWFRLDAVVAAQVLAVVAFAAAVGLAAELSASLGNRVGGSLTGVVLVVTPGFRGQALSGMEVGLASALGLAAILAIGRRRSALAGVLVGLALLTKLDAAALAVGVVAAAVIVRAPLGRLVAGAAGVTVPWFVLAWAVYGTPLPQSLTAKLDAGTDGFDQLWLVRQVGWPGWVFAVLGLLAAVEAWRGQDRQQRGTVAASWLWVGLHLVAYSSVDLGDPYPWYGAVLLPPLVAMGSAFVGRRIFAAGRPRRSSGAAQGGDSARSQAVAVVAGALVATAVLVGARDLVREVGGLAPPARFERVLAATREAGAEVARRARPGEVVDSCFGWVAYAALEQVIDDPCGLTTERSPGPPDWIVVRGGDSLGPDRRLVAGFAADCGHGGDDLWLAVLVRRGSAADRRAPSAVPPIGCS